MQTRKLLVEVFCICSIILSAKIVIAPEIEFVHSEIIKVIEQEQIVQQKEDTKFDTLQRMILNYDVPMDQSKQYAEWILKYSEEFFPDFDHQLICAHFFIESRFRTDAINKLDPSYGLGQIMIPTAKEIAKKLKIDFPKSRKYQIEFLLEPENNIQFALYYLSKYYNRLGCPMLAIAAYNGNPSLRSKHLQRVIRLMKARARREMILL